MLGVKCFYVFEIIWILIASKNIGYSILLQMQYEELQLTVAAIIMNMMFAFTFLLTNHVDVFKTLTQSFKYYILI